MAIRWKLFTIVLFLLAAAACRPGVELPRRDVGVATSPPVSVGQSAPPFQARLATGEPLSLTEELSQHKVVMLDFWATWCGPCLDELPMLDNLAREYAARGVGLLGVNQREDALTVSSFLKQRKLKVRSVLDENGSIGDQYGAEGIPMLVLVDSAGTVRGVHLGYHPALENELRSELDALLGGGN